MKMLCHKIRKLIISPVVSLIVAYITLIIAVGVLFGLDFFDDSTFFRWGPPISIMGKNVTDDFTFYVLLTIFTVHEISNTWVSETTYPFIINTIQDHKTRYLPYNKLVCMLLVIFNTIYSELDLLFVISGSTSQVSIYAAIVLGELCCQILVNWCYLNNKEQSLVDLDTDRYSIM